MLNILNIVLPVFIVIFIGYAFGKIKRLDMSPVVDMVFYIGLPSLIFTTMLDNKIILIDAGKVWASSLIVALGCGIVAWIVFKALKQKHSALYLAIMIINTMYIPFPIIYFAYGSQGLLIATLFYIANVMVMFSLGIYLIAGQQWRDSLKAVLKTFPIYAAIIGILINIFNVTVPELVIRPLNLMGMMTLPLSLLILGYNLSRVRITSLPTTFLTSFLRIGIGLLLGIFTVNIFGLTGISKSVVILESAMPTSITASILAVKYDKEADLVSSVILMTTILSLVIIPFLLHMLA
jgi:predicted permease